MSVIETSACRGCGEDITASALTNSYLDVAGMEPDGRALVYGHGKYMHMHDVAIVPAGTLTVRWAVRRLARRIDAHLRWRLRAFTSRAI